MSRSWPPRSGLGLAALLCTLAGIPSLALGGMLDTPLPTFSDGKAAQRVGLVPTVVKNNNLETVFICTNLHTTPINIGVEVFDKAGVLANSIAAGNGELLNVGVGATGTIGTSGTAVLTEDETITAIPNLRNGSGRIVATSPNVACIAMLVDERHEIEDPAFSSASPPRLVVAPVWSCGNSVVDPFEACDDGNTLSGDGCSDVCAVEVSDCFPPDENQQRCINNLNKGAAKVMKRQGAEILSCLKNASRERLLGTLEECLTDDIKGKVLREQGKLNDKVGPGSSCDGANAPNFGFSSAATGGQASVDKELRLVHSIFGGDLNSGVIVLADPDKAASKCQQGLWKVVQKCQDTKVKVFGSCKKDELKGKNPSGTQVCNASQLQNVCLVDGIPDPKGKIPRKCLEGLNKAVAKRCIGQDTDALFPGCNGEPDLVRCVEEKGECEVCQALNEIDELFVDCDLFDNGIPDESCP